MKDTPTPITNARWEKLCCSGQSWYQIAEEMKLDCRQLESELTAAQEELKSAIQQRDEARLQAQHYRDAFYKNCEPYLFSWEQPTN